MADSRFGWITARTAFVRSSSILPMGVRSRAPSTTTPAAMPAVLVAGHAPFTWGTTPQGSVQNAVALEAVAEMALGTRQIDPHASDLEAYVLEKHYQRKHGPAAYYGQRAVDPEEES